MPSSDSTRPITRRDLLERGALVAGAAVALPGLQALVTSAAHASQARPPRGRPGRGGYGPLERKRPVAVYTDFPGAEDVEWLALPDGFEYVVFGVAGDIMSDGNPTPSAHDGMGAFKLGRRRYRLIRNHENRDGAFAPGSLPIAGSMRPYDPRGGGGTTTLELEVDRRGRPHLVSSFVSLNGTIVNCAGGVTPWGSWISSQETTATRGGVKHGYNFEVSADARGPVEPIPLTAMGRFSHEAVAVDPRSGIVYQTEDAGDSGFYQFLPNRSRDLHSGTLQMLKVEGETNADLRGTSQPIPVGAGFPVEWVTIPFPDPNLAQQALTKAIYNQGRNRGAANFGRLEGCWYDKTSRSIVFICTNGGSAGRGQVWAYLPRDERAGELRLLYDSPQGEILANPDNLTASPGGGLLICEDHSFDRPNDPFAPLPWARVGDDDQVEVQYLKGLTESGEIFDFVANALDDKEWAGACFSPDGRFLFANTQGATSGFVANPIPLNNRRNFGRSYAIWGPWGEGAFGRSRRRSPRGPHARVKRDRRRKR